jgi:hypothetical protein
MTKKELIKLLEDCHDNDEILILSPGKRALIPTTFNQKATSESGCVVINAQWKK